MPLCVAVPKEQTPSERRCALTPDIAKRLLQSGVTLKIEQGMGEAAFFADDRFGEQVKISDKKDVWQAQVILTVQMPHIDDIQKMAAGTVLMGLLSPHQHLEQVKALRDGKITALAMELVPRISRAQAIDVLSSQAAIAGYKAVLMAADKAAVFFPMLTTAAGTIRPAKVLIIGAGVAGLQAIATARRLGAMVEAYDVRAATKEQCQSLGAKFIDMPIKAEGQGGYARELTADEKKQQRDILAQHVAASHVVITTAAIPGRPSPKIIDKAMVEAMAAGSVIVDLAAEGGGNCELTRAGETLCHNGVTIHAPLNVTSQMPVHASEMYAKNLYNLLILMLKEGELHLDWTDEIIAGSTLTHDGVIKHAATRQAIGA